LSVSVKVRDGLASDMFMFPVGDKNGIAILVHLINKKDGTYAPPYVFIFYIALTSTLRESAARATRGVTLIVFASCIM